MIQRTFYAACGALGAAAAFASVWWSWDCHIRDQGRRLAVEAEDWLQSRLP